MDRLEPRIHDEIKDYKEKFYNFTLRQWIFGILIILTTVPLYLFLSPKIGSDLTGWLVIIIAIPIGFFGFIPIQGLNAERIIFYWKRNYINFAKPILYKTEEELLLEKTKKKTHKKTESKVSKKDLKISRRQEKIKLKELKKDRKKQREIAQARKKFNSSKMGIPNNDFSLSKEEAQVLMKLAKQVVGKESDVIDESKKEESQNEEE